MARTKAVLGEGARLSDFLSVSLLARVFPAETVHAAPDEADNVKHFGYPGSRTGHTGYPHAQCAVLIERHRSDWNYAITPAKSHEIRKKPRKIPMKL